LVVYTFETLMQGTKGDDHTMKIRSPVQLYQAFKVHEVTQSGIGNILLGSPTFWLSIILVYIITFTARLAFLSTMTISWLLHVTHLPYNYSVTDTLRRRAFKNTTIVPQWWGSTFVES
jgi:hypothetical protein